jgi:predicted membrane GTPase involved in stress response
MLNINNCTACINPQKFYVCSILGMVDGAVLLVDAVEGPLAQTKFVLAKALSRGLAPIVVLNKVDRPAATQARCDAVASQLFDLFASLGADDRQLDFPILYASSKQVGTLLAARHFMQQILTAYMLMHAGTD